MGEDRLTDAADRTRWRRIAVAAYRHWVLHPRWSIALKGAIAAAIAWFVGQAAPEPLSDYPYYAPLGAVVATGGSVVRSVREGVQSTAAVVLGAVIARGVDLVLPRDALSIALVVGLALLCGGWQRVVGDKGMWTVTSALFVLLLGGADSLGYTGAYTGLVLAGAVVGVAVNAAFPALPLTPSEVALDRLRDVLADQADAIAEGLEGDRPPTPEEWRDRRRDVDPTLADARAAVARSEEAARANPRARRYREWEASQVRRADGLGTGAAVIDELVRLVEQWETDDREDVALGPALRPAAARAMHAYAAALRTLDDDGPDLDRLGAAEDAIEALREAVRESRERSDHDFFVAGAIVLGLRRGCDALRRR